MICNHLNITWKLGVWTPTPHTSGRVCEVYFAELDFETIVFCMRLSQNGKNWKWPRHFNILCMAIIYWFPVRCMGVKKLAQWWLKWGEWKYSICSKEENAYTLSSCTLHNWTDNEFRSGRFFVVHSIRYCVCTALQNLNKRNDVIPRQIHIDILLAPCIELWELEYIFMAVTSSMPSS